MDSSCFLKFEDFELKEPKKKEQYEKEGKTFFMSAYSDGMRHMCRIWEYRSFSSLDDKSIVRRAHEITCAACERTTVFVYSVDTKKFLGTTACPKCACGSALGMIFHDGKIEQHEKSLEEYTGQKSAAKE